MDTSILMYFFTLLAASIGLLCIVYYLIGKKKSPFFLSFAFGKFLQGIGVGALAFTGPGKALDTVTLPAIAMMTGFVLEIFTFISYNEIFDRRRFRLLLIVLALGILALVATDPVSIPIQIAFFGLVNGFLFMYGGLRLLQERRNSTMAYISGWSYLIYAVIWFISAFHGFSSGDEFQLTDTSNPAHLIISIFTVFNFVVGSVGYLIAQKELAEIRIREQVQQIASDNALLSDLIETKNRFFSIIAHDLRGPIGAMSQIGELLSEEDALEDRDEMIRLITDTSKSSFILLENLLFWARSESGALEMRPTKERLRNILDQSIHVLNGNLISKKQHLTLHCSESIELEVDVPMVSTIFRNLLSNAIKFTPVHGNIVVTAEQLPNRVVISFRDDGIGMDQEQLNRLRTPLAGPSTKGTSNEEGTGLGLKLCKEFIARHHGKLHIESQKGKGSTFEVELPKEQGEFRS